VHAPSVDEGDRHRARRWDPTWRTCRRGSRAGRRPTRGCCAGRSGPGNSYAAASAYAYAIPLHQSGYDYDHDHHGDTATGGRSAGRARVAASGRWRQCLERRHLYAAAESTQGLIEVLG
jgi:hypothetical protein